MTLTLAQTKTALAAGLSASFLGGGGTPPYAYGVLPGGAGGSINSGSGVYTAPTSVSSDPLKLYDTIKVVDGAAESATARILVGTPLLLFCEVLQQELGLAEGRVYLWDQKIMQPTDSGLYIAVSVPSPKPFSNINRQSANGATSEQIVNMLALVNMDIISRGPAARDRKEEVILALNSTYAQQQQEGNSFYIGKIPPSSGFLNLSEVDGAAIPYRYRISVNIQYAVTKMKALPFFDTFASTDINTDS